jgi:hypothetical protein
LQAPGHANNGNTKYQSTDKIPDGCKQTSEQKPEKITEKVHELDYVFLND